MRKVQIKIIYSVTLILKCEQDCAIEIIMKQYKLWLRCNRDFTQTFLAITTAIHMATLHPTESKAFAFFLQTVSGTNRKPGFVQTKVGWDVIQYVL